MQEDDTPPLDTVDPPTETDSEPDRPMPLVAIVGRPNVGKSSLLNRLVRRRVSIVQDQPGVTRDRVSVPLEIDTPQGPRWVELIDTGGFGFEDQQGLTADIKQQVVLAVKQAEMALFVVDAHAGLVKGDEEIAQLLRTASTPVLLIANKADADKFDIAAADFSRLGFGSPMPVSATTGRGSMKLRDVLRERLDLKNAPHNPPDPDLSIAIVGKRNAGKSTLVNAIARIFKEEEDRVIVSEVAGTTRDSVDVVFRKDGRTMTVIDTAGVRKRRHMLSDDVEYYSYHRAQRSIRRAGVVFLLVDATVPLSDPDKKLGRYIADEQKPVIIVCNKWDLARDARRKEAEQKGQKAPRDGDLMEEFGEYLEAELPGLAFAPVAFITARDGRNVSALLDAARALHKASRQRVSTGQLNRAIEQALEARTPGGARGGRRRPKVFYATQVAVDPPHVVLFVNDPGLFDESYRRFLHNRLRDELPFGEVPLKLSLRPRRRDDEEGGSEAATAHRSGSGRKSNSRV
ncbi:MAG: ribosome biogenesis GTPase Der [Planctomycetota bacterium]